MGGRCFSFIKSQPPVGSNGVQITAVIIETLDSMWFQTGSKRVPNGFQRVPNHSCSYRDFGFHVVPNGFQTDSKRVPNHSSVYRACVGDAMRCFCCPLKTVQDMPGRVLVNLWESCSCLCLFDLKRNLPEKSEIRIRRTAHRNSLLQIEGCAAFVGREVVCMCVMYAM